MRLSGAGPGLTLQVQRDRTCLEAQVDGAEGARMVPLGDGALASQFAAEIGVRTRDVAFERAAATRSWRAVRTPWRSIVYGVAALRLPCSPI